MDTRFRLRVFMCGLFLAASQMSFAQSGSQIVRIPDGQKARCIDPSTDQIYLTLRRGITEKSRGWLKKDAEVALIIKVAVDVAGVPDPILVPLAIRSPLSGYAKGQVSLPIEYRIVRGLRLTQADTRYTGLSLEVTVLNTKSKTPWGRALQALIETAQKIPLPESPVSLATGYLFDIANIAIDGDLEDQDHGDKVKSAAMALNFDPTGECSGSGGLDFEHTGTLAVIGSGGLKGPGYVEPASTNEYCWTAELRPSFVLKAAKIRPGVGCNDASYRAKQVRVTNDYMAFFLNAVPVQYRPGSSVFMMRNLQFMHYFTFSFEADRTASLARCRAHDVAEEECF